MLPDEKNQSVVETPADAVTTPTEGQVLPEAEVTLDDKGEGAVAPVAEPQQQQPKQPAEQQVAKPKYIPRNRISAPDKINQLTRERGDATRAAEALRAENERLKQQMAHGDAEFGKLGLAAIDLAERNANNALGLGKAQLKEAIASGDVDKQAEAQAKIAAAASDLAAAQGNKQRLAAQVKQPEAPRQQEQPRQQPQQVQQQPQQQEQLDPRVARFVTENPWMDKNSAEFDPDMAETLIGHATVLEKRLIRQGKENEIGTESYYEELERAMQDEFPDRFGDGTQPQPQPRQQQQRPVQQPAPRMNNGNGRVAPANASPTAQPAKQGGQTVKLSPEDREMARLIRTNSGLKYPNGHPKAGQPLSDADAEIQFAKGRLKDMENHPQYYRDGNFIGQR